MYVQNCVCFTNKILSFFYFCRYVALKGPKFAYYESKDVSRSMYSDQLVHFNANGNITKEERVAYCMSCRQLGNSYRHLVRSTL